MRRRLGLSHCSLMAKLAEVRTGIGTRDFTLVGGNFCCKIGFRQSRYAVPAAPG